MKTKLAGVMSEIRQLRGEFEGWLLVLSQADQKELTKYIKGLAGDAWQESPYLEFKAASLWEIDILTFQSYKGLPTLVNINSLGGRTWLEGWKRLDELLQAGR